MWRKRGQLCAENGENYLINLHQFFVFMSCWNAKPPGEQSAAVASLSKF